MEKKKKRCTTNLNSLRKEQTIITNRKHYLVLFSLSGMLQKELAALDIFESNLLSKTPTSAGTEDCPLPDCGCWQESCLCCVEHFGPAKRKVCEVTVRMLSEINGYVDNMGISRLLHKQQKLSAKISTTALEQQITTILLDFLFGNAFCFGGYGQLQLLRPFLLSLSLLCQIFPHKLFLLLRDILFY